MDLCSALLLIAIGALAAYYLFSNFNFFKRHGIICAPIIPMLSDIAKFTLGRSSIAEYLFKLYNYRQDAKYYGIYAITLPVVVLRDPQIIKKVLIKDFEAFRNRRPFSDVMSDVMVHENMFSLQNRKWRDTRTLLTPAFTAGRMKIMFTMMTECTVHFFASLSQLVQENTELDVKRQIIKYTNDIITTCAFGIKVDTVKNPNNDFFTYGSLGTRFLEFRKVPLVYLRTFWLAKLLRLRLVSAEVTNFFVDLLRNIMKTRDDENIVRPDMIQLMMEARNKRLVAGNELDIVDMTAQAFIFYFGGFETTATTLSFVIHELACNPHIQAKLRQEIDRMLTELNGEVTYESLAKLEYLEAVLKETLRMYPPNTFLERVCCKDQYELPPAAPGERPCIIRKGTVFWIPSYAIHRDDKYFEEPDQFRPERFLNGAHENAVYYLPWGLGPRMCIAKRFAVQEMKLFLFHMFARYEVKTCPRTTGRLASKGLQMFLENGFWLNMQRRGDMHPTIATTIAATKNDAVDA